ncbi:nucleotidyltransferase family protein [Paracoccus sp. Ld10]|uniref:nucleotidyltransferase family protein n=1 Tax=Paracoccus sp. Ld10 TaxID=649158 RepID=UPI00386DC46A
MSAVDRCQVSDLSMQDPLRWQAMGLVEALGLPQRCIGAGFRAQCYLGSLPRRGRDCGQQDVDVLFYGESIISAAYDAKIEAVLCDHDPNLQCSVKKNEAGMHHRNRNARHLSVEDAMRFRPETAIAFAAARYGSQGIFIAPFGLNDLERPTRRPTSTAPHKVAAYHARFKSKNG